METEIETRLIWLEKRSFRIVLISTFTALSVVLGYLLVYLPNIELFTLTIFLSGFVLGKRDGITVGFSSSFIFCFFNPFGASPLPLFIFQLVYYSTLGSVGGVTNKFLRNKNLFTANEDLYKNSVIFIFGLVGAVSTSIYQVLSSIVDVLFFFGDFHGFVPYFITGIPFTIIHIVGNTLGFIFILPGTIMVVFKMLY
ncbi:hypothetical protein LCGC14_1721670 [marine sediment metagenome]|uniref:ECF transporter S component n=1 Tax=marine sediment metagenome TaxID=412755 RepID=A0A0F9JSN8_9ZZZZ